jgi:hypothetical protein
MSGKVSVLIFATVVFLAGTSASAVTIGQVDTFESGTTEGWTAGGGPMMSSPPVPPHVVPSGGPAGDDDEYLVITSQGGSGVGSRLTAFNIFGQWAGNYLESGVGAISMDLNNLGSMELTIRLEFENPFAGGDEAVTNTGIVLAAGSGWTHAVFPVRLSTLTALEGSVAGALSNTTVLRIIHAPGLTDSIPVAGVLGVDNIAAVPEPATLFMSAAAIGLLALRRISAHH